MKKNITCLWLLSLSNSFLEFKYNSGLQSGEDIAMKSPKTEETVKSNLR